MSMYGVTLTVLTTELIEAAARDEGTSSNIGTGILGAHVSEWLRSVAEEFSGEKRPPKEGTATQETAKNIRRNLKKMSGLLEVGNDKDSQLIDLVNHIDTLAQQLEGE